MFVTPTIQGTRDQQLRDIRDALPDQDVDTGPDSDYGVRAMAVAGVADGLYRYQSWILRQVFPDTATPEFLELQASTRNVWRKKATASSGTATITGTPGSELPINNEIRGQYVGVTTTEAAVIGDDGTAIVAVKSTTTGAYTNTTAEFTATLVSPPMGINSTATVGILTGGTDQESPESLLARYLDVLRQPPAGGNKYDYKRWALEVDGVTSAYVYPLRRGLGTVDVAITSANDVPPQSLIDTVLAHIEDVRPVTAKDTLVVAPDKTPVDFVIQVSLNGLSLTQATPLVQAVVTDFMNRLEPGESLIVSQLETQISLIPGVTDRKVVTPSGNVTAIVDETQWQWLRAGIITVELIP